MSNHSQISFYFTYISMPLCSTCQMCLGRVRIIEQKSQMLLTEFPLNLIKLKRDCIQIKIHFYIFKRLNASYSYLEISDVTVSVLSGVCR